MGRTTKAGIVFVVGLLGCGCATAPDASNGNARATWNTDLGPALVAWLAADVGRSEFPAADPLPQHAGAPLWQASEGRFLVIYGRTPPGTHRLAVNVRLGAPPAWRAQPFEPAEHIEPARWEMPATGIRGPGDHRVRITVTGTGTGGSRIEVESRGEPAGAAVLAHLRRVLTLAEDVAAGDRLLREKRWDALPAHAAEAVQRFGTGCCSQHREIAARLHGQRTAAEFALRHPGLAARSAGLLRSVAPGWANTDLWLAHLSQNLGREDQTRTAWERQGLAAGSCLSRYRAAGVQRGLPADTVAATVAGLLADADARVDHGDLRSARDILRRARAAAPDDDRILERTGVVLRASGDHRGALELALLRVELGATNRKLIELADAWNRAGNPAMGVRVLARHWSDLLAADPAATRRSLAELARGADVELVGRILAAEGSDALAELRPDSVPRYLQLLETAARSRRHAPGGAQPGRDVPAGPR